jgi:hypothetical protein
MPSRGGDEGLNSTSKFLRMSLGALKPAKK